MLVLEQIFIGQENTKMMRRWREREREKKVVVVLQALLVVSIRSDTYLFISLPRCLSFFFFFFFFPSLLINQDLQASVFFLER